MGQGKEQPASAGLSGENIFPFGENINSALQMDKFMWGWGNHGMTRGVMFLGLY